MTEREGEGERAIEKWVERERERIERGREWIKRK
jgi:hypothetical protein